MSRRSGDRQAGRGAHNRRRGSYERHDSYFHQARRAGYVARSVFKLDELQRRFQLMRTGDRVLDLGCAPGAWIQLAAVTVGSRGRVIGLDLEPVTISLSPWVTCLQENIEDSDPARLSTLGGGLFHVVLSDLAPHTTGIQHVDQARSLELATLARDLAREVLIPGGHLTLKIFDGGDVPAFIRDNGRWWRTWRVARAHDFQERLRTVSRSLFRDPGGRRGTDPSG